jgi:hypothetical protein
VVYVGGFAANDAAQIAVEKADELNLAAAGALEFLFGEDETSHWHFGSPLEQDEGRGVRLRTQTKDERRKADDGRRMTDD